MTRLQARIAELIAGTGPIPVSEYMATCLFDPQDGYYTTREPFGAEGDFVTAPEISQMFGELVAVWLYQAWQALGRPNPVTLAEIGPGRGTLMKDMLRALMRLDPGFAGSATFAMIETSPRLAKVQKATLSEAGAGIGWHETIATLPEAPLLIVGEAPGRDEDLEGKPFVGRAGQLLDRMLAAIDMGEANVHITNIVYWRPPGNRTPTPQEALACRPFLERQIALVAPRVVLALGGSAAKQLFDVPEGIMRLRGKWRTLDVGGEPVKAMATLHPAYLLRTPAAKGMAWRDLLAVKVALKA